MRELFEGIMIRHIGLGENPEDRKSRLAKLIRQGEVTLGGYRKTKIYGTLHCGSGKRMKLENRVFFKDEHEAISEGYRPCGNCLSEKYKIWKSKSKYNLIL
ncbi:metal-binding protein [Dyadobacter sp. CY345]|uniref:Ada metal-binding domain-containing protein n=1 Tax=Dyadobacter sp. CY345 TaxID=2909335 RepID=UPI001F238E09|nr:Ada metal-binding domain-containing protein [Dyadobacter sp. CY345]MCF2447435.1 metal-binding protein [Dyadobacter sp. CY345]